MSGRQKQKAKFVWVSTYEDPCKFCEKPLRTKGGVRIDFDATYSNAICLECVDALAEAGKNISRAAQRRR